MDGTPCWLPSPNGLSVQQVHEAVELAKTYFKVKACALASVDPAYDQESAILKAGIELLSACVPEER